MKLKIMLHLEHFNLRCSGVSKTSAAGLTDVIGLAGDLYSSRLAARG